MSNKGKRAVTTMSLIFFAICTLLFLAGCVGETYQVDYGGEKDFYKGAKDAYRAGQEVTLYYTLIATDTDYFFYLDGEPINRGYDERKGFIICFTMPDHDVKLECITKESMVYTPAQEEEEANEIMLLSCRRMSVGGDGYHELVITTTDDPEEVRLDEYIKEEGGVETQATFYIPYRAAQEILLLIEEYGLSEWNGMKDGISSDGTKKVCMFWGSVGYVQVSTDHMPEDGEEKLDALFKLVESYANEGLEE